MKTLANIFLVTYLGWLRLWHGLRHVCHMREAIDFTQYTTKNNALLLLGHRMTLLHTDGYLGLVLSYLRKI